jgi:hypothetical protein
MQTKSNCRQAEVSRACVPQPDTTPDASAARTRQRPGPKPAVRISLWLPLPPTTAGGMSGWTAEAKAEIGLQLRGAKIRGPAAAQIDVGIQNVETTPLPTVIAPLLTLLVDCDVIESEARLVQMRARWDRATEPGRIWLHLAGTVPPHRTPNVAGRAQLVSRSLDRMARQPRAE